MNVSIAHIVNPYRAVPGSEHAIAQPITLASMEKAKREAGEKINVSLYAAIFRGDEDLVPNGFQALYLERSLANVVEFNARPLPLIRDVLDLLYKNSEASFLIYSNIDIGLQPDFYKRVEKETIGLDSLVINRRGISSKFSDVTELSEMYKEEGSDHPGYDCFVFRRELVPQMELGTICIGIPRFERTFVLNLIALSKHIRFIEKEKFTFHIGETILKSWGDKFHCDHNQQEYLKIRKKLWNKLRITNFPAWDKWLLKRYLKWIMNPNFSFFDNLRLEWRYRLKGR